MEGPAKLGIGVAVATLLIFGGIVLYDKQKNATGEGEMGTKIELLTDRSHIPVGSPRPAYNSDPPTSGPHYAQPADWSVYTEPLPDEQILHNLEHGGVNILYKSGTIDEATIQKLATIQHDFPNKTIVAPRPANDAPLILTSWGYLLKLNAFDENTVREFIRRNKNHGPEFFPD